MSETRFITWRKSDWSDAGDNCVEIGVSTDGRVGIRDSKRGVDGAILELTSREFAGLVATVRKGALGLD